MSKASDDVLAERQRQIEVEGYTAEIDDSAGDFDLAVAGACYVLAANGDIWAALTPPPNWPWSREAWKQKGPRRDLVRAAALIIAEIDRMDRAIKP